MKSDKQEQNVSLMSVAKIYSNDGCMKVVFSFNVNTQKRCNFKCFFPKKLFPSKSNKQFNTNTCSGLYDIYV